MCQVRLLAVLPACRGTSLHVVELLASVQSGTAVSVTCEPLEEGPRGLLAREQDSPRLLALRFAARQHVQQRRLACDQRSTFVFI